jgi:ABC-type branched-subunit amino acid transport system substrate-binding protein
VLSPDNDYGNLAVAAFRAVIESGGGTIVTSATYPKDSKSFAAPVAKLTGSWDAVFVADNADNVALVVADLAAKGHWPKPLGTKKSKKVKHPILLLATADELTDAYLATAGRQSEGAWLAPGFYPDDTDPNVKAFHDRFGADPSATAAYAYDAAQLAASAAGAGRTGLPAILEANRYAGLTGTVEFDAEHRRKDDGVIYTVENRGGSYVIRAVR